MIKKLEEDGEDTRTIQEILNSPDIKAIRAQIRADAEEMKKSLEASRALKAKLDAMEKDPNIPKYITPDKSKDKPWVDPDFSTIQNPTERKKEEDWFNRWCTK